MKTTCWPLVTEMIYTSLTDFNVQMPINRWDDSQSIFQTFWKLNKYPFEITITNEINK